MKLGQLFRSAARTQLLRVLHYQPGQISLRHLARVAEVHPHSAELALKEMVREGLVTRHRSSNRVLFAMEPTHPDVPVLAAVFEAAAQATIQVRSQHLGEKARSILPFAERAMQMIDHARRNRHGA